MKINENTLAKEVHGNDTGKEKSSIGQTKEVIKNTLDHLAQDYEPSEVLALIEKHRP